jgi:N-acetylglutamate synthase-like GNAT family acetyltransferase
MNMDIDEDVAKQIADLINAQNQLSVVYDATKVLRHKDRYVIRFGEDGRVLGCVEVKKVQWYQCEVNHLSVHQGAQRKGLGTSLLLEAEGKSKQLGAQIVQCTIRAGNVKSENLFKKNGYTSTVTYVNPRTGNPVTVYQKVLT